MGAQNRGHLMCKLILSVCITSVLAGAAAALAQEALEAQKVQTHASAKKHAEASPQTGCPM